jgi:hypothetical protein
MSRQFASISELREMLSKLEAEQAKTQFELRICLFCEDVMRSDTPCHCWNDE